MVLCTNTAYSTLYGRTDIPYALRSAHAFFSLSWTGGQPLLGEHPLWRLRTGGTPTESQGTLSFDCQERRHRPKSPDARQGRAWRNHRILAWPSSLVSRCSLQNCTQASEPGLTASSGVVLL